MKQVLGGSIFLVGAIDLKFAQKILATEISSISVMRLMAEKVQAIRTYLKIVLGG